MNELNPASRLRKTEAGLAAIKERDRAVAPRARTLLILVDGSKTVAQLAAMNGDATQGLELLGQLVSGGYVSVSEDASPVAPAAAGSPPAPASPPASRMPTAAAPLAAPERLPKRDLKTSMRSATKFLEAMMGPGAEPLNLQLERCKSIEEFEAKVHEITLLLARARSVKKAEEFSAAALGG